MYARLSRWAGLPPERLHETVQEFEEKSLPLLEQQSGFEGVTVMIDERSGKAAAVTYWTSLEDLRATEKLAQELRTRAESTAQAKREPVVDSYEVVLEKAPASSAG
jgi:heme-degrading monooxygenase HmoA